MPGSLEKTIPSTTAGLVARRQPGGFVALHAHAVADAMADEIAESGLSDRRQGGVIDGGAGRARHQRRAAGEVAGLGGFEAG